MKRGQTTIILTILVVSMFFAVSTSTDAAMGYQALVPGDQLLYKNVFTFYEDLEQQLFHEIDVADSWWVIDHWDYTYDEMESYYINSIDTTTANVNYAWSLYDRYNNRYMYDYYYDYPGQSWALNTSFSDYETVTKSSFEVKDFDVYDGTLNLDATEWFSNGAYNHSEVKYYIINGVNTSYDVDVYIDVYDYVATTAYTYEGINFDETNPYGWEDVFYVDSDAGFLLEYTSLYYDNYYRDIDHKNSPTLGTFVDYYFNHTYGYYYEWQLYETSIAYAPVVADADLPVLIINTGTAYDIRSDVDYMQIFFDLVNKWPSMTIEVLLDGSLIDTLYGMAPGFDYYNLYTAGIPISANNHTVTFNVYDDASFEHNTTWTLEIQDLRPNWPVITGPVGEYWYTVGDYDILQWEFNDLNDNGNYYELRINGVLDDRSGLWTNGTMLYLDLCENITFAGDHYIQVLAADYTSYMTDLYLTVHASEPYVDVTAPTITGTPSDFTMNEGEDIKIIWSIYDENPLSYEVKVNGALYDSGAWTENSKDILVLLKDFEDGVWMFEIIVLDAYSNPNSASVTVTIDEVVITTPEPTETPNPTEEPSESNQNSNTLTLDSSSLIYSILGILTFVSIVAIYRKRR